MPYNPGSETHYKMLWDAFVEMGHTPKIKPSYLITFSGFRGECADCGMLAFSGQKLHGNDLFTGTAIDNECPVKKEK